MAARGLLFKYPALPKWEARFYWMFLIGIIIYAYSSMYDASRNYKWGTTWNRRQVVDLPIVGKWSKDITNYEWFLWVPVAKRMLPGLLVHSVVFSWAQNRYQNTQKEIVGDIISFLTSTVICCVVFSPTLVAVSMCSGLLVFTMTRILKHPLAVWLTAIPILYVYLHKASVLSPGNSFLALLLLSYKMLSFISYNLDYCRGEVRPKYETSIFRAAFRMLCYAFYLPYLVSLIVIYTDFERQMEERRNTPLNLKEVSVFAARIAFWFGLCELVPHLMYFDAIIQDPFEMRRLSLDRLCIIGMTVGQYFQLKYVAIFGVPAVFARLDRMQPPKGPICVSRLMLYSRTWREFDRGLYSFFKAYIFLPICAPTFALWRKVLGVFVSYGFVLVWHGFAHQNLVWIALNIIGLFLEMSSKATYVSWTAFREAREKHISDRWFRRMLAWLHIIPYALALYSNFYFLGGAEPGWIFVDRFYYGQTVTFKWPFLLIICFGYMYAHCCMDTDRFMDEREKKERKEK